MSTDRGAPSQPGDILVRFSSIGARMYLHGCPCDPCKPFVLRQDRNNKRPTLAQIEEHAREFLKALRAAS